MLSGVHVHVVFLQGNVKGDGCRVLSLCGNLMRRTDYTIHFESTNLWGKAVQSLHQRGKMCNKFTKEAALPPRNISRRTRGKTAIPATTHNSVQIITAPTQAPGVLNSF